MFSHVVVFWTDPTKPGAADELIAGARQQLGTIPGVRQFHAGRMVPSPRPVVEQSYQVALNLGFADRQAEQRYQAHPQHVAFVEQYVKRLVCKTLIYDFE